MTTTESEASEIDPAAADRLARLRKRHADAGSTEQRPAAASKIVAAGASTMAVLGLMAVYGQRASSAGDAGSAVAPPPGVAVDSGGVGLPTSSPVILVLVEGADPSGALGSGPARLVSLAQPEANRVQLAVPTSPQSGSGSTPAPQATSRGS